MCHACGAMPPRESDEGTEWPIACLPLATRTSPCNLTRGVMALPPPPHHRVPQRYVEAAHGATAAALRTPAHHFNTLAVSSPQ